MCCIYLCFTYLPLFLIKYSLPVSFLSLYICIYIMDLLIFICMYLWMYICVCICIYACVCMCNAYICYVYAHMWNRCTVDVRVLNFVEHTVSCPVQACGKMSYCVSGDRQTCLTVHTQDSMWMFYTGFMVKFLKASQRKALRVFVLEMISVVTHGICCMGRQSSLGMRENMAVAKKWVWKQEETWINTDSARISQGINNKDKKLKLDSSLKRWMRDVAEVKGFRSPIFCMNWCKVRNWKAKEKGSVTQTTLKQEV